MKLNLTEDDIRRFCEDHYYCDPDENGERAKWEPFEHEDDGIIKEHIENDVIALMRFIGLNDGFFPVTQIHRDDLAMAIGEDKAKTFTDAEMTRLARKMADDYLSQLYWDSMRIIAEYIMEEREDE